MKRFIALALATATLSTLPGVAQAAPWQSINARQANQYARINLGVRNGALTAAEASRLKSQFLTLNKLEQQYRRGGLTLRERQDLDRRFTTLSRKIRTQKNDAQAYR